MRTDLLKYDAADIKELLRRKLLENGVYTDQIYPGSDTSLLIDLFAWTFDVLTYMLNENASDILFSDSSVYENLNKIVKLLSYKPKAYTTSTASFSINLNDSLMFENQSVICTIPKFASISTWKNDKNGVPIKYSFIEDYTFNIINGIMRIPSKMPILYNGVFTKYVFNNQATSRPFEVFIMTNVGPNGSPSVNIDNDTLHVFTEITNDLGEKEYQEVKIVNSLVADSSFNDLHCEARLNENKEFEIKFGDGIHGKRLAVGTIVNVIYLSSNGAEGVFDSGVIESDSIDLVIDGFSSKDEMIKMVYGGHELFKLNYSTLFTNNYTPVYSTNILMLKNETVTSPVIDYETTTEIQEYAPSNFRLGNRLVTDSDFRTYILHNFKNRVNDVYVCNNTEYCSLFYKWLDRFNKLDINIRLKNYEYANACDFNNIYLWMRPLSTMNLKNSDKEIIIKDCNRIKTLTTQLIPCEGIKTYFMPYFNPNSKSQIEINSSILSKSFRIPTKILIKKQTTYFSDVKIKTDIAQIITDYFNQKYKFGETIILSEIQQKIFALGYIDSIKTVSTLDKKNGYYTSYCEGLSFAKFTSDIISFADFEVFNQTCSLERFQYGLLLQPENIHSLIEITSENTFALKNDEF